MYLKKLILYFLISLCGNAWSNPSWIWMKGASNSGQYGHYGEQGIADSANTPGARIGAASWIDALGKIWIFGGNKKYLFYQNSISQGFHNDLWKYDPASNCWTWMKGSNTTDSLGSYGVMGVESQSNNPRARAGAAAWTDATGRVWMYGGAVGDTYQGSKITQGDFLGDLWLYNSNTNNWTWIMGSSQINQETSNTPGYISDAATCIGPDGRFWLFGGTAGGLSNALWVFDPVEAQWSKVKGGGAINQMGVYGTQGVADPSNKPGARYNAVMWSDKQGRIWLFGGFGYGSLNAASILSDLWCFDPVSSNWTWVKGGKLGSERGTYGVQGIGDPANTPGAFDSSMGWTDGSDRCWLFGGFGWTGEASPYGPMNELWLFNPETQNWTWIQGRAFSGSMANYGTPGIPSAANVPGGRGGGAVARERNGTVWIFGGSGFDETHEWGLLNDLWRLTLPNAVSGARWKSYP